MALIYQEEGQAEAVHLLLIIQHASFAYQNVERDFNSTKGAWHHRHVQVQARNLTTLSPSQIQLQFHNFAQLRGSVWAALCCELILKRASDPQQSSDWQAKCRMSSFCATKADETKLFKKNTQYLHNAIRCNFMNICS